MKIAIIAAYNEEDAIGSVVIKTKKYVDRVLVIDDGSKDKTAEIAKTAGAEVIRHIKNKGKGEALKTGFDAAEKLNADVVVCLDGDAQHDPVYIPNVIAPIISGDADMVIASRYIQKKDRQDIPKYRRLGLWILTSTQNLGSKVKVTDTQCGFRAFSGDVLEKFRFKQTDLSIESEMLEDAIENQLRIVEVPFIPKYNGIDTNSEKPGRHGLGVLKFILRIVKEKHPLLFFGVSGLILLLVGTGLAIFCIDCYFSNGFIPFAPSLAAAVSLIVGALSVFAGLILNSISGMIQGLTLLTHSQKRKVLNDIENKKISKPTIDSGGILKESKKGIDKNNISHLFPLNRPEGTMAINYGNKMLGPALSKNLEMDPYIGNIKRYQLMTLMNFSQNDTPINNNNENSMKDSSFLNDHKDESYNNFTGENIVPGLGVENNHRREMALDSVEEKNIQL